MTNSYRYIAIVFFLFCRLFVLKQREDNNGTINHPACVRVYVGCVRIVISGLWNLPLQSIDVLFRWSNVKVCVWFFPFIMHIPGTNPIRHGPTKLKHAKHTMLVSTKLWIFQAFEYRFFFQVKKNNNPYRKIDIKLQHPYLGTKTSILPLSNLSKLICQ